MTDLVLADCVGVSFRGRPVLTSASLRAAPGRFTALLGRNGAGKSTLLKIAAGWIRPDTGMASYGGRSGRGAPLHELARHGLFYLPDHDLFSNAFTVQRHLEMFHRQYGGPPVLEAAERMGVAARVDAKPHALSGGELRRAELAAVFVRQPQCLLADEPYRGVAPKDAEALSRAFRDLAESGVAVVVTGHEVPTLLSAADHVTWCTSGTTHELGTPGEAIQHEQFAREYLGSSFRSRAVVRS